MEEKKKEIRFLINEKLHKKLEKEAKECDVPLASYTKVMVKKGRENVRRRKKDF